MRSFYFRATVFAGAAAIFGSAGSVQAATRIQKEVLIGNGTAGPYALSWKNIVRTGEAVTVNTLPQLRGLDYTFDPDAGTVTFVNPLSTHSTATVEYIYDSETAHAVSNSLIMPLQLNLAQSETSNLFVSALYRKNTTDSTVGSGQDALTLGVGTGWQGGHNTQLTTRFFFAPSVGDGTPTDKDRMGWSLAGGTNASRTTRLSFNLSRDSSSLTNLPTDAGLQVGNQHLGLGLQMAPSRTMTTSLTYSQDATAANPAAATSQIAAAMTLTPNQKLKIQTNLQENATHGAAVSHTASVAVDAKPAGNTQVTANYATTDTAGTASDTQTMNLGAAVGVSKTVAVTTNAAQSRTGSSVTSQQGAGLRFAPNSKVTLNTSVNTQQDSTGNALITSVDGTVLPARDLSVSAAYKSRDMMQGAQTPQNSLDTTSAKVALGPSRLRVTGSYVRNADDGGTPQQIEQRGFGLETNVGALSLSGGYDWRQCYAAQTLGAGVHLALGLRLSSTTQLTGGFQQSLDDVTTAPHGASTYSVGFKHNVGDRFQLAVDGTVQQSVGTAVNNANAYTANASLGMKF
ncbi:hypothetical protein CCAX7_20420 [Capsulimonas corticalis]|uniref:Uncharacterized protein n=1 Tax=Capsulimonas corticalis TaxID=2219043 RepID=A0A402D2D7_9BACT|nr:hypothetical protein [Capsulimonas corticalis]BDI29991.1 hypothetical protein CCAX7_20420 [Capsulimonas corticalis]